MAIATTSLAAMFKFNGKVSEISLKSEEWQEVKGAGCSSAGSAVPWWTIGKVVAEERT